MQRLVALLSIEDSARTAVSVIRIHLGVNMFRIALLLALVPATAFADKIYDDDKGGTYDCASDPVVNINAGKGVYTFTGACTSVNLNGADVKLTAESIDELNINGATNTVIIATADAINVNGDKNTVTWAKAKTGTKPKLAVHGARNTIVKKPPTKLPAKK